MRDIQSIKKYRMKETKEVILCMRVSTGRLFVTDKTLKRGGHEK